MADARTLRSLHLPQVLLACAVVGILGMMVVPLPTAALDLLIALNLATSVLVLAVSLYARDGLSFAAFPSLLLLTTLYRLALNVSSTRLILLQADAGRVIDAFGHFVVRGDYWVGAVVFVILTIVQFAVIARGAERVAEVGARFTLDALPGKQLAIDAEQRGGQLSPRAARTLRRRLDRESQFYGAMDGAMKFVKGDAVASLAITGVNLIAGVSLGTFARGDSLEQAARTYGLLTIGDGLVSQLPALLVSTAAGLVVTRVASEGEGEGSLASDLAGQLAAQPRALWVAAAATLALGLLPGFPTWAFALLSGLLAGVAYLRGRAPSPRDATPAPERLGLDAIQVALDTLADTHPALLACSVPRPFSVPRLARLLRALDAEGVDCSAPLASGVLPSVLESLSQQPSERPLPALLEAVRAELSPAVGTRFVREGTLRCLRLRPGTEDALLDARVQDGDACWLAVEPALSEELAAEWQRHATPGPPPPLLVRADLRRPLWNLLELRCPGVVVLSARELPRGTTLDVVAWMGPL